MGTTVELLTPPAEADVHRGARALSRFPGVWRVAVFGSVGRDEAHQSSDIDYLVICNSIDYSTRNKLALQMRAAASDVTSYPVDIILTDTAEWAARTALPSTFETHIENEAIDIVLKQPDPASAKDQPVTMATPAEQATARLQHMTSSLDAMQTQAAGVQPENRMHSIGRPDLAAVTRESRWVKTLQQAEMALEHGLNALIHTTGGKLKRHPRHHLEEFRDALPEGPVRDQVVESLKLLLVSELRIDGDPPLAPDQTDFTVFRKIGDYGPTTVHDRHIAADRVLLYMNGLGLHRTPSTSRNHRSPDA